MAKYEVNSYKLENICTYMLKDCNHVYIFVTVRTIPKYMLVWFRKLYACLVAVVGRKLGTFEAYSLIGMLTNELNGLAKSSINSFTT